MADHICHLPMLGKKESLNVAVAAGIGMYSVIDPIISCKKTEDCIIS
jgi:tRNA G18 (ribose-2'-O)-methylase SpoU